VRREYLEVLKRELHSMRGPNDRKKRCDWQDQIQRQFWTHVFQVESEAPRRRRGPLGRHIERLPVCTLHEVPPDQDVIPACRQPRPSPSSRCGPISVKSLSHLHLHRLSPAALPSYLASPSNDVPLPFAGCARSLLSLAPAFNKFLPPQPNSPRYPHLSTPLRPQLK
jgi:hypothetical protein